MAKTKSNPSDPYAVITARIANLMEQGTIPWRKPWKSVAPQNLISGQPYRGINPFILSCTGHSSRLSRPSLKQMARFGSPTYSLEELLAEMGAAFLCGESGLQPAVIENQAAYISGWLKRLKGDPRLVVIAAAQAQKSADFILNRQPQQSH